jgi:WD40 repeat protein
VRLWEVSSGKLLNVLQGHTGTIYSVAFSLDSHTLARLCWRMKEILKW